MCRSLNNSRKYAGANRLRDLNITIAFCFLLLNDSGSHFNVSRSRLEFTSQLACRITLAARILNQATMRKGKSLYDFDLIKFDSISGEISCTSKIDALDFEVGSRKSEVGSRKSEVPPRLS